MSVYAGVWYLFTIITYGVHVPAGLFLPGNIIGCALGTIYHNIQVNIYNDGEPDYVYGIVPILLASGAMLSSYTRLTYSLVVVMLETTSSVNIFAPMIIAVMVARWIANIFTPSLYARAIQFKGIPMLPGKAPLEKRKLEIQEFMTKDVFSVPSLIQVE